MFLVFHILTLCLWVAACAQWLALALTTPEQMGGGG